MDLPSISIDFSAEVELKLIQELAQLPEGTPPRALAQALLRRLKNAIGAAHVTGIRVVDTSALEVRAAEGRSVFEHTPHAGENR